MERLTKLRSNGRLLSLPANIRLRWKFWQLQTLAYYVTATIMAVKSLIVQAPGVKVLKCPVRKIFLP